MVQHCESAPSYPEAAGADWEISSGEALNKRRNTCEDPDNYDENNTNLSGISIGFGGWNTSSLGEFNSTKGTGKLTSFKELLDHQISGFNLFCDNDGCQRMGFLVGMIP